jgi:hypothetical protein
MCESGRSVNTLNSLLHFIAAFQVNGYILEGLMFWKYHPMELSAVDVTLMDFPFHENSTNNETLEINSP